MHEHHQARIAYHGAIVLFVGLLCGVAAVTEPEGLPMPSWQAAHGGLLLNGVWMLAIGGIAPRLVLEPSHASALFWSLIAMSYGFVSTLLIQAAFGIRGVSPGGPLVNWLAFAGNVVVVGGTLFSVLITLQGAHGWVRRTRGAEASATAVAAD
jgi:hypothetical protein